MIEEPENLIDELEDLLIDAVARETLSSIEEVKLVSHAEMVARFGEQVE